MSEENKIIDGQKLNEDLIGKDKEKQRDSHREHSHYSHRHSHSHKNRSFFEIITNFEKKFKNPRKRRKNMSRTRIVTYILILIAFMICLTVFQTVSKNNFNIVIPFTFVGCCAIGFIFGSNVGAVAGLLSGLLLDYIGTSGLSYSPPLFLACGFFCGHFAGWFLSYNFPSFVAYIAICGIIKEISSVIYYSLLYQDYLLVLNEILIPDYVACMLISIPIYFAVKLIYNKFRKL